MFAALAGVALAFVHFKMPSVSNMSLGDQVSEKPRVVARELRILGNGNDPEHFWNRYAEPRTALVIPRRVWRGLNPHERHGHGHGAVASNSLCKQMLPLQK